MIESRDHPGLSYTKAKFDKGRKIQTYNLKPGNVVTLYNMAHIIWVRYFTWGVLIGD